ncbi:MAG: substrate-binding domain-containing protein [Firmicutes bacterium]|nr:substrate-binding domain-containing protein [Bacillota bacterium]
MAIANPSHAPYGWRPGKYCSKVACGLWERLEPKFIYARDVLNALQCAFVGKNKRTVPDLGGGKLYAAPRQTMAIIGSTKQVQLSKAFVDFVKGPKGRRILEKYGFRLP